MKPSRLILPLLVTPVLAQPQKSTCNIPLVQDLSTQYITAQQALFDSMKRCVANRRPGNIKKVDQDVYTSVNNVDNLSSQKQTAVNECYQTGTSKEKNKSLPLNGKKMSNYLFGQLSQV